VEVQVWTRPYPICSKKSERLRKTSRCFLSYMKKRHTLTKHHLIPTSRGGTNHPDNIKRLRDHFHIAFHKVFDNATPDEQIKKILEINSTVIKKDVQKKILRILDDDIYNSIC
jgi:hypothetical protein